MQARAMTAALLKHWHDHIRIADKVDFEIRVGL
jgi:hypothetical protein